MSKSFCRTAESKPNRVCDNCDSEGAVAKCRVVHTKGALCLREVGVDNVAFIRAVTGGNATYD